MTIDERGRTAGQRTVARFEASTNVAHDYDRLVDRRQSQRRNRTVALATAFAVAVFAVLFVQGNFSSDSDPQPMEPVPGIEIGAVPVWYDDAGLHRGDVVEQTPVELRQLHEGKFIEDGALALVRTGALYLDPATRDVWFHPWGGDPRIVGHDSTTGPSANPSSDIAVWLEGWELVVYDTVADREIARTLPRWPTGRAFGSNTCNTQCFEHLPPGNGFLDVSAERVVWKADGWYGRSYVYDVRTGEVSSQTSKRVDGNDATVVDVHDDAVVYGVEEKSPASWYMVLGQPGRAPHEVRNVDPVDNLSRFSPSGDYVLSEDAAIIDAQTGEVWPLPGYAWIAWSYGDTALADTKRGLLACDASLRTCENLPVEGLTLMPTN